MNQYDQRNITRRVKKKVSARPNRSPLTLNNPQESHVCCLQRQSATKGDAFDGSAQARCLCRSTPRAMGIRFVRPLQRVGGV
eukprot:3937357-Pyramimonas_sp.AAC.1